jgi:hypothetical protein
MEVKSAARLPSGAMRYNCTHTPKYDVIAAVAPDGEIKYRPPLKQLFGESLSPNT